MPADLKRIDWDDPVARAQLLEQVGVKQYNQMLDLHRMQSSPSYSQVMHAGVNGEGGKINSTYVARKSSLKPMKLTLRNRPYKALMETGIHTKATHTRLMEAGLHGRAGKRNASYKALMAAGLKKRSEDD